MEKRKDNTTLTVDERIDKFLQGKMDQEEADQFRSDLQSDSELRFRATILASVAKTVRSTGKSQDENLIKTIPFPSLSDSKVATERKDEKTSGWLTLISGIAACAVIGLFVVDYHKSKVETQYLAQQSCATYKSVYSDFESICRGNVDDKAIFEEIQAIILELETKENIKENIKRLSELFDLSLSDTYNQYSNHYKGIGYYLAVAYLQNNDKRHAKEVLGRLLQRDENDIEAKGLLEKINGIKGLF